MSYFSTMAEAMEQVGPTFNFGPFAEILQPLIEEVVEEKGLTKFRKGTILLPKLLIWLVLALTIRRDLSYHKVFNWMVSGFRWLDGILPPLNKIVSDGAISHARVKLGVEVLQLLFVKLVTSFKKIEPDFYGYVSVAFDGTTGTMPDSEANQKEFAKPKSGRKQAAFPQLRLVSLLAVSVRLVLDVAYGSYAGKGSGERALMGQILERLSRESLLFLLDAGLYDLKILWGIDDKKQKFLVKVPRTVKLKRIKSLPDGSYLAQMSGKIIDPDNPKTKDGRNRWKKVRMIVRIIDYAIPGFRPAQLMTNILDPDLTARELALHYHQRWDIEIAYDEIKTHQCATLRGQSPTTFRSKRPDLVVQELYAMLIMYNLVRLLIVQAAAAHGKDPRFISFLDALQHIIDAAPLMTVAKAEQWQKQFDYLLALLANSDIDHPRRHRVNPRVVKVTTSKFKRKRQEHLSEQRNLEKDLEIISQTPETTKALVIQVENTDTTKDLTPLIIISTLAMITSAITSEAQL
ncbi:MAG: IS4 family transposase [Chloroflexi bacterium]|nr:IS4 family transposase [Chloroflexota bacterium]